ncbi:glycoside hydrolase family 16 protein [Cellulophaga baltica]|uniref:glycoside hydrolase family 16 protein n=1 Tax=Cellulophaga baltica TaxID=76594 RepID=UPI0004149320|nr:glycoside hydrolase family 16 protein [Cellulophaga baltica]WFO15530.1 glycoside hydrolase family 16 protein [Cellulophaga baltica 4]
MKKSILIVSVILTLTACSSATEKDENVPIIPETVATCGDGIKNGSETAIDCGGASCVPCVSGTVLLPESGYNAPESYEGYVLLWNDEFETATLNNKNWSFHKGNGCPNLCGWGNDELQYYTEKNHALKDGNLVITAKKENLEGYGYTSTRIHTADKFEFKYGRVDIRAAMPSATGTWAALWLLNKEYTIQDPSAWWPNGGEIDLMEYLGEAPSELLGTAHYGRNLDNHQYNSVYTNAPEEDFTTVYHVFSIVWEENKITWLLNNKPYHTVTPKDTNGQPYPFNDTFYLVMNLSVGGNLPVPPIASQYPAFLSIDYVRVFQKN